MIALLFKRVRNSDKIEIHVQLKISYCNFIHVHACMCIFV